jgi:hypothetical protein
MTEIEPEFQRSPREWKAEEVETYVSADAATLHASQLRVWSSAFEFIVAIGQVEAGLHPTEPPKMKQVGTLYMSPAVAKNLTVLLFSKLAEYEQKFGPIPGAKIETAPPGGNFPSEGQT